MRTKPVFEMNWIRGSEYDCDRQNGKGGGEMRVQKLKGTIRKILKHDWNNNFLKMAYAKTKYRSSTMTKVTTKNRTCEGDATERL